MSPRTFEITMDSNVDDVVVASAMLRSLFDQLGLPERDAEQMELCLMEALVNTVRHAYKNRPGNPVILRFRLGKADIHFEVEDHGTGCEKKDLEEAIRKATAFDPTNPDTLAEGGRGMLIIHEVMTEWDYFSEDGRNVLTMSKRIG